MIGYYYKIIEKYSAAQEITCAYRSFGDDNLFNPFLQNYNDYRFFEVSVTNPIYNLDTNQVTGNSYEIVKEIDYLCLHELEYNFAFGKIRIFLELGQIINYTGTIPEHIIDILLEAKICQQLLKKKKNELIAHKQLHESLIEWENARNAQLNTPIDNCVIPSYTLQLHNFTFTPPAKNNNYFAKIASVWHACKGHLIIIGVFSVMHMQLKRNNGYDYICKFMGELRAPP